MSLNGSGVFTVNSAGQPVVSATLITSAAFNAFTADVATALSTAIYKDGQQTVTANIPFGGFKLTNVGLATAGTDAATLNNILAGTGVYVATVGGTGDVITLTPSPAIAAYAAGQAFWFIASGANTTNVTVAVSGLTAKAITKNGTTALIAGDIPSSKLIGIRYDGTQFQLVGSGDATYSAAPFIDSTALVKGSADASKLWRVEVDGLTASTTRVYTPADQDVTQANTWVGVNDFRLSLTTGLPVTTADVTGAGTLYAVPYTGSRIALYNGTFWQLFNSAQFSLALTLTSGKPYDIWGIITAGAPALEVLVWTNDTSRATALAYQNGVLVKSGDATRRYLGSLYASGANTTEDSLAKRYLWNYYNRVDRPMQAVDTTNSWSYNTATIRQANAAAANQIDYIQGVSEDMVSARILAAAKDSNTANWATVGVGVDSTTAFSGLRGENGTQADIMTFSAFYQGFPGVGRHVLSWNEFGSASVGTITWYGDDGSANFQSGINGNIRG